MKLSLPAAVLIGLIAAGALVAGALVDSSPRAGIASGAPSTAAPAEPPRSAEALTRPRTQVELGLEPQVIELARSCWSVADAGDGMKGAVDLQLDADGKVLTHGVKEEVPGIITPSPRGQPMPPTHGPVLRCIDEKLRALHVPAPGASAGIEIPFTLP